ncbi:putative inner membrane protein [Chitinispirillum alkaliphilum]|nr:putative inner membrane protein [Chitinispirillum alkaliphilum]
MKRVPGIIRKNFFLVKLMISILVVLILIYTTNAHEMGILFSTFNWYFIFPVILILIFSLFLSTINIFLLLKPQKVSIPLLKLFRYYLFAWAIGLISPGKLGEFSIVFFLKKHNLTTDAALIIPIINKLLTVFALLIFSLSGTPFILKYIQPNIPSHSFLFALPAAGIFFLFLGYRKKWIYFIPEKILNQYRKLSDQIRLYTDKKRKLLLIVFSITLLKWIITWTGLYLIIIGFDYLIPLHHLVFVLSTSKILSLIPITLSGLGVREGVAVYLFSGLGYSPEIVLGSLLIMLTLSFAAMIPIMSFVKVDIKLPEEHLPTNR